MKALRRFQKSPRAARIEDVPIPEPGPSQVLLKVHFCGVCGSDLHAYLNHPGYEAVLEKVTFGHEVSGVVESVGANAGDWQPGDRAIITAIQPTDPDCPYVQSGRPQLSPSRRVQGLHLDGGMAEYIIVDQQFLIGIPSSLELLDAALTEPLSVADHCVVNCSSIRQDDKVIVSGPGIIGMLCAIVARQLGANVIVSGTEADSRIRLAAAQEIGFQTVTVGPEHPPLHTQANSLFGSEADALVEASGAAPALSDSWQAIRMDGSVTIVALYGHNVSLDVTQFVRKQIDIQTSYGSALPSYKRALDMLTEGIVPVECLVRTYKLEEAITAFCHAANQEVMKPILEC